MDGGNGEKLESRENIANGGNSRKSSNDGSVSGTDVDSGVLLVRNVNLRGSLTTADRPRPSTGVDRGSNVGSHSHHFVGSKKPDIYADRGYVRPHHSRADVNISKQAVNDDDDHGAKGDLSTVESSKSDTELLMNVQDSEAPQGDSATRLGSLLAKAVTLDSSNEVVRQSNSSDEMLVSYLNKCNSSSKAYDDADLTIPGQSSGVKGYRSDAGIFSQKSATGVEDESRRSRSVEGKRSRSSHSMLGRIKVLTSCLSSSDEGRSQEDMTASSEDASPKRRLVSKIPRRKMKKRKRLSSGEDVEKSKGEEEKSSSSGTEVGKAVLKTEVDTAAAGTEVEEPATGSGVGKAVTGMEVEEAMSGTEIDKVAAGIEVAKEGVQEDKTPGERFSKSSPPDVVKEIEVSSYSKPTDDTSCKVVSASGASTVDYPKADQMGTVSQETKPSGLDSERIVSETRQVDVRAALVTHHSGSSIELLCEYGEHVDRAEPILAAIVAQGSKISQVGQDIEHVQKETSPEQKISALDAAKHTGVVHHASAPMTLNQTEEEATSQPEIALKAVKERYRVLSEQISDAIPGVSIDDKLRMAVLGSFSYAAESGEHREMGRRAASAPGPLEHMAEHLAQEFAKDQQKESGISSCDGPYYDESSNHLSTPKTKEDSGSSKDSTGITNSQLQEQASRLMSSSDSSQDEYIQQMERAQRLISPSQNAASSPTPQQLHLKPDVDIFQARATGDLMGTCLDADLKTLMDGKSLREIKEGNLSSSITSAGSSGYGSTLQARIADIQADLGTDDGLKKPHQAEMPMEEDSVRKKELGYILRMLQKDGSGGQAPPTPDSHRDPGLLEAAVSYLYWSRHDAQDLLKKPQQHQKVVMEDKLETQNLQLDLPPHSGFRGSDTLEQLKAELEMKMKQIQDAISAQTVDTKCTVAPKELCRDTIKPPPISQPVTLPVTSNVTPPDTEAKYSSSSSSSSEDSRPPSSFCCNQSVAIMSPGSAFGSGLLLRECERARRVRREAEGRIAELEREKGEMAVQMKDQRLAAVQLEAHLLSQLTSLTREYQSLMAHDQEHKQLARDLRLQLDKKEKDLEQAQAHFETGGTDSQQLQDQLDALSFESKEKIHQLSAHLTAAEQQNLRLQDRLRQEAARHEALREASRSREEEAGKAREALMEELQQERSNHSQLDAKFMSQATDLHQLTASLQDLQNENHTRTEEVRHLCHALEESQQERAELQQQLQRANQRLDAEHVQWKKQKQQLRDQLNEVKASLEKSQLHLRTLTHTNQTLSSTTAQLQESYQALNSQLHKERLAKEMTSQDMERIRVELEAERKTRSELVNSQLSQWQQNLEASTQKLSAALKNKICHQQQELEKLRATNTELAGDLHADARHSQPSTSAANSSRLHDPSALHAHYRDHHPRHLQPQATCCAAFPDWTSFDTEGGVGSKPRQGWVDSHEHKRC